MTAMARLAWILVGAVGALGTSLEEALANVTSQVTGKFGNSFTLKLAEILKFSWSFKSFHHFQVTFKKGCTLRAFRIPRIEALVCKNHFCEQKATDTMKMLSDLSESSNIFQLGLLSKSSVQ